MFRLGIMQCQRMAKVVSNLAPSGVLLVTGSNLFSSLFEYACLEPTGVGSEADRDWRGERMMLCCVRSCCLQTGKSETNSFSRFCALSTTWSSWIMSVSDVDEGTVGGCDDASYLVT